MFKLYIVSLEVTASLFYIAKLYILHLIVLHFIEFISYFEAILLISNCDNVKPAVSGRV